MSSSDENQIFRRRIQVMLGFFLLINLIGAISLYGTWLKPQAADCIVIIAAGGNRLDSAGDFMYDRMLEAVRLYQAGWAEYIIISGNGKPFPQSTGSIQQALIQAGIPEEKLFWDAQPLTTRQSIIAANVFMQQQGFQQAILVTNQYHMLRSHWLAKRSGMNVYGSASHSQHGYWITLLSTSFELPAILLSPWLR